MSRVRGVVIGPDDVEAGRGSEPARTGRGEQQPLVVGRAGSPSGVNSSCTYWSPALLLAGLCAQAAGARCELGCPGMPRARRRTSIGRGGGCAHLCSAKMPPGLHHVDGTAAARAAL